MMEPFQPKWQTFLKEEQPSDIYASIVSSQFDADRLDYLRRDKLMTGTEQGGFDWAWLMNNLEVEKLTIASDDDDARWRTSCPSRYRHGIWKLTTPCPQPRHDAAGDAGGPMPGVNLDKALALADAIEDHELAARMKR